MLWIRFQTDQFEKCFGPKNFKKPKVLLLVPKQRSIFWPKETTFWYIWRISSLIFCKNFDLLAAQSNNKLSVSTNFIPKSDFSHKEVMLIFNPEIQPFYALWAPIPVVTDIGDPGDGCSSLLTIICRRILQPWIINWKRNPKNNNPNSNPNSNPKRTACISDQNGQLRQQMQKAVRLTMFP